MGNYNGYIPWSDILDTSSRTYYNTYGWNGPTYLINNVTNAEQSIYSWKSFQKEKPDIGEKIIITGKDKINYYVVEFLGMGSVRRYNAKYWQYLNKCDL